MDGGAYCTLTPVVLSRGTLHAGGPYACPNVRIFGRAVATNTPPNGAFRGFGAPQTEFAAEMQVNRIAEALGMSPLELRRTWVYRLGDETPSGQILRESVAGEEVLERAAEAAEFERIRAQTTSSRGPSAPRDPASPSVAQLTSAADRTRAWNRPCARLARRRLHRQWRGQAGQRRQSLELTADGRDPRPDRVDGDGPGHQDDLPAARRRAARRAGRGRRDGAAGHLDRARFSGPTVASRTAMVVGGLVIKAAARMREMVESMSGATVRGGRTASSRSATAACASTSSSSPIPTSTSTTRPTAATPTRPTAGRACRGRGRRRSRHGRGRRRAASSRPTTSARSSTRSWPRARSKAARCRESATRRSRRSSSSTAATSTTDWPRT